MSRTDSRRPPTRGSNRNSRLSSFDPPPPYASPRPSESAAARSHFAPLSRIGTRNLTERSPPQAASPVQGNAEPDRSTYASSDVIVSPDHEHARSSSPLEWPSQPRGQDVISRKPVPSQSTGITSQSTSHPNVSHLAGPIPSYLPERISGDAFSIDTTQWEDPPRQDSTVSSLHYQSDGDESSTVHPHNIV